jgi:hypothetical protein
LIPAPLTRRTLLASLAAWGHAWSAPVGPALDRPAVPAHAPSQGVLLGAALAGTRWVAVGERGLVIVSDDRGRTWAQSQVPVSVTLTAVAFVDAGRGYATGHGGTVLGTRDGGLRWTRLLDGRAIVSMLREAAARSGDESKRKAAERMSADGPDKPLLDLVVSSPNDAFVVGAYGLALATSDGGRTWSLASDLLDNPKALHLYSVRRREQVVMIAGEQGLLLRSDNGGRSFRRLASPYNGSFFTLELPSETDIVAAGLRGNVWRSNDAGGTWHALPSPGPAAITGSSLAGDGRFILASQAGQLMAGNATSLELLKLPPLPPLTGVLPVPGEALLALSLQGLHLVPFAAASANAR